MDAIWAAIVKELGAEWPTADQFVRVTLRLVFAAVIAGIIGWNRERGHKTAGLRTHMLVSLGSALFVLAALESVPADDAGQAMEDVSRVIQGVAAGIGFVGGGAVLKMQEDKEVRGLTTASSVWLAAAIGVAAGMGRLAAAAIGVLLAWFILSYVERVKEQIDPVKFGRDREEEPP